MNVALCTFTGSGVLGDRYRPDINEPGYGLIDLRPDKTVPDGLALVALRDGTAPSGRGVVPLGALNNGRGVNDTVGPVMRALLSNRFGRDLSGAASMRDLVRFLLFNAGVVNAPTPDDRLNGYPIYLGHTLVDFVPRVAGGAIWSDPFHYSNGVLATVSSSLWQSMFGAPTVSGDKVQPQSAGSYDIARWGTATDTNNQFSEVRVDTINVAGGGQFNFAAARCRMDTGATDNNYNVESGYAASSPQRNIVRIDGGSGTTIATDTSALPAVPFTCRCEVSGSSVRGLFSDGLLLGPVTDTTYASGRIGFQVYAESAATDCKVDEWRGGDLNVQPTISWARNGKRM